MNELIDATDAVAAHRSTAIRPFPSKLSYWFREKVGELRLALRSWLGIDDAEASLSAIEGQLAALREVQTAHSTALLTLTETHLSLTECVNTLRKDLDADQKEFATERAADLERLALLETNVDKVSQQNGALASSLNGVTMLALAWREVPILKRAEKEAQARRERTRAEQADRAADAVKNAPAPITDGALNDCR